MNIFVHFYFRAARLEREKRENKCSVKISTFTVSLLLCESLNCTTTNEIANVALYSTVCSDLFTHILNRRVDGCSKNATQPNLYRLAYKIIVFSQNGRHFCQVLVVILHHHGLTV